MVSQKREYYERRQKSQPEADDTDTDHTDSDFRGDERDWTDVDHITSDRANHIKIDRRSSDHCQATL